ncbi:TPA: helix-turn-helix domain-containing protein, partial [Enterococcus faecium]|nr:helix-turn-helix domain-containing protein [Enterococcus faecium]
IDTAYESLVQLFSEIPEEAADFLANQLSGNERTGLLPYQLAKNNDESAVYLQQSRCIHLLLAQIEKRPDSLWHALIDSLLQQNFNQSMMITKQMFMNGQTIDQIMAIRHLKRGTVTDHLIEWALFFDDFPYEWILSAETIERLEPNKDSVREWRFSEWNVDGQLDYGEFRLYQIYLLRKEAIQNVNK